MTDIVLSANEIFKSLNKKLNNFDDDKIKTEANQIIMNCRNAEKVDFSGNATRNCKPEWLEFFLNLIYQLLEVDNKYGRMAASHILQKLCPILTPDLIKNMLSFVIEFYNESDDSDQSDSDDEGMLSEDDVMLSGDEDSTLEDDDCVSDEEETNEPADELNIHSLESLRENMMASFEPTDINLDDVPAEELKQFDKRMEKLMKAFQGKLPAKEDKIMKLRDLAQKNVRFRGCDLLKIVIKKAVNPTHLVILLVPLLQTIQTETDKEFILILRKLCEDLVSVTTFEEADDLTDVVIAKELKKLLYMSNERSSLNINGIRFLIKTGEQACKNKPDTTKSSPILDVLVRAMEDFFTVKFCPIDKDALMVPLNLTKGYLIPLCDVIRKHAFSKSNKSMKKTVALNMLIASYQHRQLMATVDLEQMKEFQVTVTSNILKILNSLTRPNQIQAKYMLGFFKLIQMIYVFHLKEGDYEVGFDWDSVRSSMQAFGSRFAKKKLSNAIAKSFHRAASTIHMKQPHIAGYKKESTANDKTKSPSTNSQTKKKKKNMKSNRELNGNKKNESVVNVKLANKQRTDVKKSTTNSKKQRPKNKIRSADKDKITKSKNKKYNKNVY